MLDVLESVFIIWLIILACGDEREERWMENGERQKEKKGGEKSDKMSTSDCCQMWGNRVRELVHVHLYIYTLKNACKQLCVHWFINLHYITIFLIPALVFTASVSSFIFTEYLVKSCIFTYTYRKNKHQVSPKGN